MDMTNAFPSKYLKAVDLQGRRVKVTIQSVVVDEYQGKPAYYLKFIGKEKTMRLNKTNNAILCDAFGGNSDIWNGKEITLFPTKVTVGSEMKDSIGIDASLPEQAAPQPLTDETHGGCSDLPEDDGFQGDFN